MLTILLVVLLVSLLLGGWGTWGAPAAWRPGYAWSPAALIVLVLVLFLLFGGRLR